MEELRGPALLFPSHRLGRPSGLHTLYRDSHGIRLGLIPYVRDDGESGKTFVQVARHAGSSVNLHQLCRSAGREAAVLQGQVIVSRPH
jgi:hypothetical protein